MNIVEGAARMILGRDEAGNRKPVREADFGPKTDFAPSPQRPLQCKLWCKLYCTQNCPHRLVSDGQTGTPPPRPAPPDCVRRNHCNLWCRRDARPVRARGRRGPRPRRQKRFMCDIIRGPSSADITHTPCARRTCTPPATPPAPPSCTHGVCVTSALQNPVQT